MNSYVEYYCNIEEVYDKIRKDGIAVIPNVISKNKVDRYQKEMWDMFGEMTYNLQYPVSKDYPQSWKNIYELQPEYSMLIQFWKVGHSKLAWNLRQEKKVIETFCKIWNVTPEELLTSFDAMSFHPPPETTKKGFYNNKDWYHTDQSGSNNDFSCVQGMVTLYDVKEGDGTFCFKEGSHHLHGKFFEKHEQKKKRDWYELSYSESEFFKDCPNKRIKAKAGSLILWDSRLFHCGGLPLKNRKKPNFRAVFYICMTPRKWSTEEELLKRKEAFFNKQMTTHNPNQVQLYPDKPRSYGLTLSSKLIEDAQTVSFETLTPIGRKLAGY